MRKLNVNEMETVNGGGRPGCEIPGPGSFASAFGVGGGFGMTIGAASGYSALATAGGIIGTALAGSFMVGFSIGVGINHAIGQCD